ncbi:MAG TPA: PAS domain S-box protein, partial [Rubrivivax sp.]|nr:PAS domain S-box protein [Rubrivivax sp.]
MKPAAKAAPLRRDGLLRALFFAYPDALLVVGADGRIVLANPAAAALLGYAEAELAGLAVDALVPSASRSRHAAYRQAYARAPRSRPMGLQLDLAALRKDGSEVAVEIALSPLRAQGQDCVVAAIRDVAAYPRVQQALRRARYSEHLAQLSRLAVHAREPRSMLEQGPAIAAEALQADAAMVYLLDRSGLEFTLVGGVGLCQGDHVGMRVANRDDTLPGHVLRHGTVVATGTGAPPQPAAGCALPATCRAAGLQAMLAVPLSDRGSAIGAVIVCAKQPGGFGADELQFLESLSNLLAASVQRAHSEQALLHAQQLESVGQLTGGIAHDFNNLLTIIQGNLQVLDELPLLAGDAHARHLVGAAARASRRGAELTGKLLAFSRRQVLQPSALDVRQLLQSLADMLRRTLDQRIRIEVDVAADCPAVVADPGQLESALLNIAINARDAMRDGGRLRFAAQRCAVLPASVRDSLDDAPAAPGGYVAIAIDDTGTGMTEVVKRRAFEPFFT